MATDRRARSRSQERLESSRERPESLSAIAWLGASAGDTHSRFRDRGEAEHTDASRAQQDLNMLRTSEEAEFRRDWATAQELVRTLNARQVIMLSMMRFDTAYPNDPVMPIRDRCLLPCKVCLETPGTYIPKPCYRYGWPG